MCEKGRSASNMHETYQTATLALKNQTRFLFAAFIIRLFTTNRLFISVGHKKLPVNGEFDIE